MPPAIAALIATGAIAATLAGYWFSLQRGESLSATTTVAGIVTLALGYAAAQGQEAVALAGAAVVLIVLASRTELHGLLKGLTEPEVESVARFAIVALVILPLLPDAQYGPYGALNPHRIWLVVVIVLGLSFAGYAATRRFGAERGILLTAVTGALVSSTAVTLDYARKLRTGGEEGALVAGIALASLVMFVRVQLVAAVVAPKASLSLAVAMLPALIVAAAMAFWAYRRRMEGAEHTLKLGNPFDFAPALLLAGLVALLSVVARWAIAHFGDQGVAILLGLTGMVDVDAAVLTLGGLEAQAIDGWSAGIVLAIPILVNTLVKALMALSVAGGAKGIRASAPLFAAVLAAAAGMGFAEWLR